MNAHERFYVCLTCTVRSFRKLKFYLQRPKVKGKYYCLRVVVCRWIDRKPSPTVARKCPPNCCSYCSYCIRPQCLCQRFGCLRHGTTIPRGEGFKRFEEIYYIFVYTLRIMYVCVGGCVCACLRQWQTFGFCPTRLADNNIPKRPSQRFWRLSRQCLDDRRRSKRAERHVSLSA